MQKWLVENQNWIMNLVALGSFLYEPVTSYFTNQPFSWRTFLSMLVLSVLAYLKGKYPAALINKSMISDEACKKANTQGYVTSSDLKE